MNKEKIKVCIFIITLFLFDKSYSLFCMNTAQDLEEAENYMNENFYLIDDLGNKITLEDGNDIKFKIYKGELENTKIDNIDKMILKIKEKGEEKVLVSDIEGENVPFVYINNAINLQREQNSYFPKVFTCPENKIKYNLDTIHCSVVKKIGEDSINDDYILVNPDEEEIEEIGEKNYEFQLLTRKKYFDLNKKLNKKFFLKDSEGIFLVNYAKQPLMFEEENGKIVLYVQRSFDKFVLAGVESEDVESEDLDNFIEISIKKKNENSNKFSSKISSKKTTDKNKTKDCCCICCC